MKNVVKSLKDFFAILEPQIPTMGRKVFWMLLTILFIWSFNMQWDYMFIYLFYSRLADDEAKERQSLLGRFRTLEHEYDGVKSHMDDEIQQKDEVGRTLNKTLGTV